MASEGQQKKVKLTSKLDEEPYISMFQETARLAHEALKQHGEPTMSREKLRYLAAAELNGELISDYVIGERHSSL